MNCSITGPYTTIGSSNVAIGNTNICISHTANSAYAFEEHPNYPSAFAYDGIEPSGQIRTGNRAKLRCKEYNLHGEPWLNIYVEDIIMGKIVNFIAMKDFVSCQSVLSYKQPFDPTKCKQLIIDYITQNTRILYQTNKRLTLKISYPMVDIMIEMAVYDRPSAEIVLCEKIQSDNVYILDGRLHFLRSDSDHIAVGFWLHGIIYGVTLSKYDVIKCQKPDLMLLIDTCMEYVVKSITDQNYTIYYTDKVYISIPLPIESKYIMFALKEIKPYYYISDEIADQSKLNKTIVHRFTYPTWSNEEEFKKLPNAKLFDPNTFKSYNKAHGRFEFTVDDNKIYTNGVLLDKLECLDKSAVSYINVDSSINPLIAKYIETYVFGWCLENIEKVALRNPIYHIIATEIEVKVIIVADNFRRASQIYRDATFAIEGFVSQPPYRGRMFVNGIDFSL